MLIPLEQSPSQKLAEPIIGPGDIGHNDGAASDAVSGLRRITAGTDKRLSPPPPPYVTRPLGSPWACQWRALSIFSGCGGLDLGFMQEGIAPRAAYDKDLKAIEAFNHNLLGVGRVTDLSRDDPRMPAADILLAGAPCQGFSTAGKREIGDPRNALLMRVADIALKAKPKAIIVENVPAALSGDHGNIWRDVEDRLRLGGYNVRRLMLNGYNAGLAQKRKRLFLLCWRGNDTIRVELDTNDGLNVRQALARVDDAQAHDIIMPTPGSRHSIIASKIRSGHKLSNVRISPRSVPTWAIPEVFGRVTNSEIDVLTAVVRLRRRDRIRSFGDGDPVPIQAIERYLGRGASENVESLISKSYLKSLRGLIELQHTYNGRYRRLCWDDTSPTVDTKFGRIELFVHPDEDRGMTPREAARLQGFPDYYHLSGSRRDQYTQIGNAVPPPMAAQIGSFVREAILKA